MRTQQIRLAAPNMKCKYRVSDMVRLPFMIFRRVAGMNRLVNDFLATVDYDCLIVRRFATDDVRTGKRLV